MRFVEHVRRRSVFIPSTCSVIARTSVAANMFLFSILFIIPMAGVVALVPILRWSDEPKCIHRVAQLYSLCPWLPDLDEFQRRTLGAAGRNDTCLGSRPFDLHSPNPFVLRDLRNHDLVPSDKEELSSGQLLLVGGNEKLFFRPSSLFRCETLEEAVFDRSEDGVDSWKADVSEEELERRGPTPRNLTPRRRRPGTEPASNEDVEWTTLRDFFALYRAFSWDGGLFSAERVADFQQAVKVSEVLKVFQQKHFLLRKMAAKIYFGEKVFRKEADLGGAGVGDFLLRKLVDEDIERELRLPMVGDFATREDGSEKNVFRPLTTEQFRSLDGKARTARTSDIISLGGRRFNVSLSASAPPSADESERQFWKDNVSSTETTTPLLLHDEDDGGQHHRGVSRMTLNEAARDLAPLSTLQRCPLALFLASLVLTFELFAGFLANSFVVFTDPVRWALAERQYLSALTCHTNLRTHLGLALDQLLTDVVKDKNSSGPLNNKEVVRHFGELLAPVRDDDDLFVRHRSTSIGSEAPEHQRAVQPELHLHAILEQDPSHLADRMEERFLEIVLPPSPSAVPFEDYRQRYQHLFPPSTNVAGLFVKPDAIETPFALALEKMMALFLTSYQNQERMFAKSFHHTALKENVAEASSLQSEAGGEQSAPSYPSRPTCSAYLESRNRPDRPASRISLICGPDKHDVV